MHIALYALAFFGLYRLIGDIMLLDHHSGWWRLWPDPNPESLQPIEDTPWRE